MTIIYSCTIINALILNIEHRKNDLVDIQTIAFDGGKQTQYNKAYSSIDLGLPT